MSRPTREEARGWQNLLRRCWEAHESLERDEYAALLHWLDRLTAALPSAAAVQRDMERRKRQADQGVPLCRGCHTHHDSGERCPE